MDEIRCKKCGLWLERPDSICPRCIAIDGGEEEKRKFYKNMDEHSIENAHISSIKKVAETLLRDGQHYIINPREIINIINMLEDAMATQIPPDSGAIRELGTRLVDLLDEDDWNNLEPFLLKAKGAQIELEAEITRLTAENAALREEVERYRAVLEGAEYRNIDNLKNESVEKCRAIGATAALLTVQLRTRLEQAEVLISQLRDALSVRDAQYKQAEKQAEKEAEKQTIIATGCSLRIEQVEKELAECRAKVENEKRQTAEVERWYRSADAERIEQQTRAMQAEAALRELYTYPGVRDLLAPTDSLGSIARRVEDVLK